MGSFKMNIDAAFANRNGNGSPETERQVELECKQIVDTCLNNVQELLRARRPQLEQLARKLLEKETLYYADIAAILEPERSKEDVQKELESTGDRKMVGTPPIIDFDNFGSLSGWSSAGKGNGAATGGSSSTDGGASTNNCEFPQLPGSEPGRNGNVEPNK
jgi:hypothetical protein